MVIGAIVLAAGESRRMGRHKMLLPYEGVTVVEHVVNRLCESGVEAVLVVAGHRAELVIEALRGTSARTVTNPDFKEGMLSSVRCGLRAAPESWDAVLIALGDQPTIRKETVDSVIAAYSGGSASIVVPTCDGKRGHPLLFSMVHRDEVLEGFDDTGLRGLLQAHGEDVLEVAVDSVTVLEDLDYPEDYRAALDKLEDAGD